MKYSRTEIQHLTIAWIVLGLCFSARTFFNNRSGFPEAFLIALIAVGAGFIFHELAHKVVAQKFGYAAEFRMWEIGLIIAAGCALLFQGRFLFAAPGAVYILAYNIRPREDGLISIAGVITNLVMAFLFYFLLVFGSGFAARVGIMGVSVNLWLAAFNLLPIPPLDGRKVMSWKLGVWIALVIVSWGLLALWMIGII